jgi:hypothetical protein
MELQKNKKDNKDHRQLVPTVYLGLVTGFLNLQCQNPTMIYNA